MHLPRHAQLQHLHLHILIMKSDIPSHYTWWPRKLLQAVQRGVSCARNDGHVTLVQTKHHIRPRYCYLFILPELTNTVKNHILGVS